MEACGIIVEYNPFHNGHLYHLNQTKLVTNCDIVIAVMSNGFVQRGDFAICSAYKRAKAAIEAGVDIVVELPYPFTLQSADKFAYGAINTLKLLMVDSICFGSESNNLDWLEAALIEQEKRIKTKSQAQSLNSYNIDNKSNDILGIAYLKALKNTNIKPFTIKRTNNYNDTTLQPEISSASAIRVAHRDNINIAKQTPLYDDLWDLELKAYYPLLRHLLITLEVSYLQNICLVNEGIENLFKKQALIHENFDDFIQACVSKKYTTSRIKRTLCHILLSTTKSQQAIMEEQPPLRLLGINQKGQQYLKEKGIKVLANFSALPPFYKSYLNKYMFLTKTKDELQLPYIHNK